MRCRHDGIKSPILPCPSSLPAILAQDPPSMTNDLEQLARWRTIGARHSEEVYDLGLKVLKSKTAGDQGELLVCSRCPSIAHARMGGPRAACDGCAGPGAYKGRYGKSSVQVKRSESRLTHRSN